MIGFVALPLVIALAAALLSRRALDRPAPAPDGSPSIARSPSERCFESSDLQSCRRRRDDTDEVGVWPCSASFRHARTAKRESTSEGEATFYSAHRGSSSSSTPRRNRWYSGVPVFRLPDLVPMHASVGRFVSKDCVVGVAR